MKFELRQSFQIESARYLPYLPPEHPCSRMHGHSFKITLIWQGEQDPVTGWVKDYHEVTTQMQGLLHTLDHHVLNEIPDLKNPTSENLCAYLYHSVKPWLPELVQVIVSETPHTECRYPITD